MLNRYLFTEQGFKGNTKNYYELENSYLNCVIDRERAFRSAYRQCTSLSGSGWVFRFMGSGCGSFLSEVRIGSLQGFRRLFQRRGVVDREELPAVSHGSRLWI